MPRGTDVGLGPDDILSGGDQFPQEKKGHRSLRRFSAHIYCDQTALWIKMLLVTEVGLGTCHIVLH